MSLPPAGCPPMPPAMIPPPLLPPMVNGVHGMPNHQIHINIGGPNTQIVHPKSFQFPLQNLDLNDTEAFPMGPHETPCLHSSDSSTTSTPTSRGSFHRGSKSRERSLTPDEEVEAYFQLTEACRSTMTSSMILPPSVQPTA